MLANVGENFNTTLTTAGFSNFCVKWGADAGSDGDATSNEIIE